ncbi:MAG: hypothetical protein LBC47_09395 [Tannerella sp.]|jgi:hypothetical protein|nr:hypothetical protein [Tannerella sp.]
MSYRVTDKQLRSLSDSRLSMMLTVAACLLCWVLCYEYSTGFSSETDDTTMPLWALAGRFFNNRLFAYSAGLFMAVTVSCVIQRVCDMEMLIGKRTRLPFMLLLLLISTNVEVLPVKEVTIVSVCLVFALYGFFKSYQSPEATGIFFNMGVLTGFAGLFMPQILWFIPLLWMGMYRFRSLKLRSFMALLTGVFIVYWIVSAWCMWKHDYDMFVSLYKGLANFKILSAETFQYYRTGLYVFILLFILSFFHVRMNVPNSGVRIRRTLSFLLDMSVWLLILILLYGEDSDSLRMLLYIPSSVLIAYFLENIRRRLRFVLYYLMLLSWLASFMLRLWNF